MSTRTTLGGLFVVALFMASALVLVGCARGQAIGYGSFQLFTYPRGSDPLGNQWQYRMCVTTLSDQGGSDFALTEKGVRVTIARPDGKLLLDDTHKFGRRAGIESTATWTEAGTVTLEIRENGFVNPDRPPRREDPYNAELMKSGGRTLKVVTYRLNPSTSRFVPVP